MIVKEKKTFFFLSSSPPPSFSGESVTTNVHSSLAAGSQPQGGAVEKEESRRRNQTTEEKKKNFESDPCCSLPLQRAVLKSPSSSSLFSPETRCPSSFSASSSTFHQEGQKEKETMGFEGEGAPSMVDEEKKRKVSSTSLVLRHQRSSQAQPSLSLHEEKEEEETQASSVDAHVFVEACQERRRTEENFQKRFGSQAQHRERLLLPLHLHRDFQKTSLSSSASSSSSFSSSSSSPPLLLLADLTGTRTKTLGAKQEKTEEEEQEEEEEKEKKIFLFSPPRRGRTDFLLLREADNESLETEKDVSRKSHLGGGEEEEEEREGMSGDKGREEASPRHVSRETEMERTGQDVHGQMHKKTTKKRLLGEEEDPMKESSRASSSPYLLPLAIDPPQENNKKKEMMSRSPDRNSFPSSWSVLPPFSSASSSSLYPSHFHVSLSPSTSSSFQHSEVISIERPFLDQGRDGCLLLHKRRDEGPLFLDFSHREHLHPPPPSPSSSSSSSSLFYASCALSTCGEKKKEKKKTKTMRTSRRGRAKASPGEEGGGGGGKGRENMLRLSRYFDRGPKNRVCGPSAYSPFHSEVLFSNSCQETDAEDGEGEEHEEEDNDDIQLIERKLGKEREEEEDDHDEHDDAGTIVTRRGEEEEEEGEKSLRTGERGEVEGVSSSPSKPLSDDLFLHCGGLVLGRHSWFIGGWREVGAKKIKKKHRRVSLRNQDVGVEVLSKEEDLQEILWYSVLLLSSLSLTSLLQCLPLPATRATPASPQAHSPHSLPRRPQPEPLPLPSSDRSAARARSCARASPPAPPHPHTPRGGREGYAGHANNIVVVLVLLFSFFAAVAGWGLVDAVVYVVAGGRAGLKIFFYFCFFACSSVFVILYVCLVDPSFNLDVVANFV